MHEIPNIITERVDDIPLLIEQMQRMGLPTLFDTHFPTHGNWTGLSLGWVSTIWLSSILSRGDHRMVHVEPWVSQRLYTLGATTGQTVTRVAFADVRNHLATPRLLELIGTDIFIYHGITELWLDGRWIKATPTFNLTLCEKFRIRPLEFDGRADAVFHPFDRDGRQHMEYLRQRGSYGDVPVEILMPAMLEAYPRLAQFSKAPRADFAKEAEEQG